MPDPQHFKPILEARIAELQHRLQTVEHELDQPADPDVEERAVEREGDEVLEEIGQVGLTEIRQIEAALSRIDDGTFGFCVACGDEIAPERLEVVPHAARCRKCA